MQMPQEIKTYETSSIQKMLYHNFPGIDRAIHYTHRISAIPAT